MMDIPREMDRKEHSLEMHMPYLYYRLTQTFESPDDFPSIVPILVGSTSRAEEKEIGQALAPYFKDEENAFVISSDFCHWGDSFRYMPYAPDGNTDNLVRLTRFGPKPVGVPIHEVIRAMDESAMNAVESGSHDAFVNELKRTRNTVCGQHPIGVALAALEALAKEAGDASKNRFKVVQYQRSCLVNTPMDDSVSYVSAYAIM